MFERIKKHVDERESINAELQTIIGHCDDSPINLDFLDKQWSTIDDELHLQVDDSDLEDDYYGYEISSLGARGEKLFMGEKDGYTYVMAHDGDWEKTELFVLTTKNKIEDE